MFEDGRSKRAIQDAADEEELYEQIGRLRMEVEPLKKSDQFGDFFWSVGSAG